MSKLIAEIEIIKFVEDVITTSNAFGGGSGEWDDN